MRGATSTSEWRRCIVVVTLFVMLVVPAQPMLGASVTDIMQFSSQLFQRLQGGQRGDYLTLLDHFLLDVLPQFVGQESNNENGTRKEFKEYALSENSNDDAYRLSVQELIIRSGYKYDLYEAVADDGYVTQLTRLVNPLAVRSLLRYPPVVMEHGGTIDPSAYMIASSIEHHPEKWPRTKGDPSMTSWNRSLAFTLANNGFDVWLAETRGSNDHNKKHIRTKALLSMLEGRNKDKNMTLGENIDQLTRQWDYWDFSQDDIIAHELKSHMDTVMEITGAKKLSLMTFSLSTPTSFAFLSIRPDYAEKVQGFISMAPIVSGQGVNSLIKLLLHKACPLLPDKVGTLLFTDTAFSQPAREFVVAISRNKTVRYSLVKAVITLLLGPSAKYQTLLELNVLGHLLRQVGFKEAKQMCQQMETNKLQKFDYGPVKNWLVYNQTNPPVYDLSNLRIKDWIIVSAANDRIATPEVAEHLVKLVNPKPIANIVAPRFNHLDLIAGFENDKYVNLPIMHYLEQVSSAPHLGEDPEKAPIAKHFDTAIFFPEQQQQQQNHYGVPSVFDEKVMGIENPLKLAQSFLPSVNMTSLSTGKSVVENFRKSFSSMPLLGAFGQFGNLIPTTDRNLMNMSQYL